MTTYYVAKSGSDSNTCVQAQDPSTAKLTANGVAGGGSCMSAGDTLILKAGMYAEHWDPAVVGNIFPSGTSTSNRTTIRAADGETVIITPPSPVSVLARFDQSNIQIIGGPDYNLKFIGGGLIDAGTGNAGATIATDLPGVVSSKTDVIFDGIEITNQLSTADGGHSCMMSGSNDVTVRNSWIHNCYHDPLTYGPGSIGLYMHGNNVLVENNVIEDIATAGVRCGGNGAIGVEPSDNCIIRNNRINGPMREGIIYYNDAEGMLVYNNIIDASSGTIDRAIWGKDVQNGDILIANNTINEATIGLLTEGAINLTVRNNIFADIETAMTNNPSDITTSNNLCTSSAAFSCEVVGDPLFVNALTGDFTLLPGSPALDAGMIIPEITDYFDGSARSATSNTIGAMPGPTGTWEAFYSLTSDPYAWIPLPNVNREPGAPRFGAQFDVEEENTVLTTNYGVRHIYRHFTRQVWRLTFRITHTQKIGAWKTMHDALDGELTPFYFRVGDDVLYCRKERGFAPTQLTERTSPEPIYDYDITLTEEFVASEF